MCTVSKRFWVPISFGPTIYMETKNLSSKWIYQQIALHIPDELNKKTQIFFLYFFSKPPYSVQIPTRSTDQKKLSIWMLFTHCIYNIISRPTLIAFSLNFICYSKERKKTHNFTFWRDVLFIKSIYVSMNWFFEWDTSKRTKSVCFRFFEK